MVVIFKLIFASYLLLFVGNSSSLAIKMQSCLYSLLYKCVGVFPLEMKSLWSYILDVDDVFVEESPSAFFDVTFWINGITNSLFFPYPLPGRYPCSYNTTHTFGSPIRRCRMGTVVWVLQMVTCLPFAPRLLLLMMIYCSDGSTKAE